MKQDLVTDLPGAAIRVRSPRIADDCVFVEFAPDSAQVRIEACISAADARALAEILRAAADHAELPPNAEAVRALEDYQRARLAAP